MKKKLGDLTHEKLRETIGEVVEEKLKYTRPDWFDELMGELKSTREEQTLLSGRQSEHSDQLENHEDRIVALEMRKKPH